MSKIPFAQQRLQEDRTGFVRGQIAHGRAVRGQDLLRAVEESIGDKLPTDLGALFETFSAPEAKRSGRPNLRASDDFAMKAVDERYPVLLRQLRDEGRPSGDDRPPSERAYRQLAEEMSKELGNLGWEALRNKHSAWRNGYFHPVDACTDSVDFEAEIERQFPAPDRS